MNSDVRGLNLFLLADSSLFSPTFLPPGLVVLLAPAFQGSGVITLPSLPFFSHFSQTIVWHTDIICNIIFIEVIIV